MKLVDENWILGAGHPAPIFKDIGVFYCGAGGWVQLGDRGVLFCLAAG